MKSSPIDRGWAWMVCAGAFVVMFFVTGGSRSIGLLFVEMVEVFDSTRSFTSVIMALVAAGLALSAPVATFLGGQIGFRTVAMLGATFAGIGSMVTAFLPNIYLVAVIMGPLTGIGYGFMWGPCLVVLGQYFQRRRSLANGIAASGGSLGQLFLPQLINFLVAQFGFRGAIFVFGAILFHAIPASALFRPVSVYPPPAAPEQPDLKARTRARQSVRSTRSMVSRRSRSRSRLSMRSKARSRSASLALSRVDVALSGEDDTLPDYLSACMYPKDYEMPDICPYDEWPWDDLDYLDEQEEDDQQRKSDITQAGNGSTSHEMGELRNQNGCKGSRETMTELDVTVHEENAGCLARCGSCCDVMGQIFDFRLFRNWLFVVYAAGLSFGNGGYINLCLFLPPFALDSGLSKWHAATLLSVVGFSDLCGRLMGGWFADLGVMRRSNITALSMLITGSISLVVPFYPTFPMLLAYSAILGTIGGVYVSLMAVVAVDFFGIANLAKAFGMATLCFGLAIIPLPIAFSVLRDAVGTYQHALWVCGVLLILGGCCFALEPVARNMELAKKDQQTRTAVTESYV